MMNTPSHNANKFPIIFISPFEGICNDGDVKLVDGVREYEGRIEVCYTGEWETVCDNHMDDSVAEVVCRQLGFSIHSKSMVPPQSTIVPCIHIR